METLTNQESFDLQVFETPFSDYASTEYDQNELANLEQIDSLLPDFESPFLRTFEYEDLTTTPYADEYTNLLAELHDEEFNHVLYEMAGELEDFLNSRLSFESEQDSSNIRYVNQQSEEYFLPLVNEIEHSIDEISEYFAGKNLEDYNEDSVNEYFSRFDVEHSSLTPIQEQFFGKIVKAVKKGIKFIKKLNPINFVLKKLKKLIRPLLKRVLKFALGKLPKNLRPFAKKLAKRFLKLETLEGEEENFENAICSEGDLETIQYEFNHYLSSLIMSDRDEVSENLVVEYEQTELELEVLDGEDLVTDSDIDKARERFISELENLPPDQSPEVAIENFLPVLLVIKPAIKLALKIIGRKRVVNFLAKLLSKLIGRFVPKNVRKPLSRGIVSAGLKIFGFEASEENEDRFALEAIANTIEDTIVNLSPFDNEDFENQEYFAANVLEAFEEAASDHFPNEYLTPKHKVTQINGVWILKPTKAKKKYYKKFSHVYDITIVPRVARKVRTFGGVTLAAFMKDKLGLNIDNPVKAKVHLFQAIPGTWLSRINKYENVPGLKNQRMGWLQIHPLTTQASCMLLKEPLLGKDFSRKFTRTHNRIAVGQRFYYLEIEGAQLRYQQPASPSRIIHPRPSSDVQVVLNLKKSEVLFNYFFSEEDAIDVVKKLNKSDYLGAAISIHYSVKKVLNDLLIKNVRNKVKLVHEAVPELFLDEEYETGEEGFLPVVLAKSLATKAGKAILLKLVEKLVAMFAELAKKAVINYFKARSAEFKAAQQNKARGVTIKIVFTGVPGLSQVSAIINAVTRGLSVGNLADLVLPSIPIPHVVIRPGKYFD